MLGIRYFLDDANLIPWVTFLPVRKLPRRQRAEGRMRSGVVVVFAPCDSGAARLEDRRRRSSP